MTTVTLKNLTRRMLVFNLPREHVPEAAQRARVAREVSAGDVRSTRVRAETVSGSVTLTAAGTPGAEVEVPASALRAPEIQKALTMRPVALTLVIKKEVLVPEAAPAPEAKKRAGRVGGRGE